MKPRQVVEYLKYHTGISVDETQLCWWERKGLLGTVAKTSTRRRDYNSDNVALCIIIGVSKLLRWTVEDMQKLIVEKDKELKNRFISECQMLIKKLPPKIESLLKQIDKLI